MIGIHGNGLTHEMWMPEDGTLIEVRCLRNSMSPAPVIDDIDVPTRDIPKGLPIGSTSPESSILRRCTSFLPSCTSIVLMADKRYYTTKIRLGGASR